MKTLVVGMQSSGASFVTMTLAQDPNTIAVVDLYCSEVAPSLEDEARYHDVIVKCTIGTRISIQKHVASFKPDRLVLVTRNLNDVRESLSRKPWKDHCGSLEDKCRVYDHILLQHLDWFDEVVSYERVATQGLSMPRSRDEIVSFNNDHSAWCREHYLKKWGFEAMREEQRRAATVPGVATEPVCCAVTRRYSLVTLPA